MNNTTAAQLASVEHRYRELAGQLADIGYIASGSLALRHNRCGKTNCACHATPPRLHGPYWLFTAKVDGKTVNKRLTEDEARRYQEWIDNDRRARSLLSEMRALAATAASLLSAQNPQTAEGSDQRAAQASSPQPRSARSRPTN